MKILITLAVIICLFAGSAAAQKASSDGPLRSGVSQTPITALETANAAVSAHGGENVKRMTSFLVRGTVDVTGAFSYVIPATFLMVISGDRYAFELSNPFQPMKQVFDGKSTHSSGYELPPITSLGFSLLDLILRS